MSLISQARESFDLKSMGRSDSYRKIVVNIGTLELNYEVPLLIALRFRAHERLKEYPRAIELPKMF